MPESHPALPKCNLCSSTEHTVCGFCTRCKEHTTGSTVCPECKGVGSIEREITRKAVTFGSEVCGEESVMTIAECGDCDGSGEVEALSECCGARVFSYDDEPPFAGDM